MIYLSAWVSVSESLVEVERQRDFLDFSSSVGPHFFSLHSLAHNANKPAKSDFVLIIFRNVDDGVPHLRCRDFGVFATC